MMIGYSPFFSNVSLQDQNQLQQLSLQQIHYLNFSNQQQFNQQYQNHSLFAQNSIPVNQTLFYNPTQSSSIFPFSPYVQSLPTFQNISGQNYLPFNNNNSFIDNLNIIQPSQNYPYNINNIQALNQYTPVNNISSSTCFLPNQNILLNQNVNLKQIDNSQDQQKETRESGEKQEIERCSSHTIDVRNIEEGKNNQSKIDEIEGENEGKGSSKTICKFQEKQQFKMKEVANRESSKQSSSQNFMRESYENENAGKQIVCTGDKIGNNLDLINNQKESRELSQREQEDDNEQIQSNTSQYQKESYHSNDKKSNKKEHLANSRNFSKNLLKSFFKYALSSRSDDKRFVFNFKRYITSNKTNDNLVIKLLSTSPYHQDFQQFLGQPATEWVSSSKVQNLPGQVKFLEMCRDGTISQLKKRQSVKKKSVYSLQ